MKEPSEQPGRYFLYDPYGDGFQTFATAELRDAATKTAIEECLDGGVWAEEVELIVVGEITGVAARVGLEERPPRS